MVVLRNTTTYGEYMVDIRSQKLLYHLTALSNLESILKNGLLPRSDLEEFKDVADHEILSSRTKLGLENFVPFHFFSRNPFDGRVQADHREERFILITVQRIFALKNNWKIVPRHPLANAAIELMSYQDGFNAIAWDAMNSRDYHDANCKSVCMAECLSPNVVDPANFFKIFVANDFDLKTVNSTIKKYRYHIEVSINSNMFLS